MNCVCLVVGLASRTSGLLVRYGHGLLKLTKSFEKALDEKVLDEKGWTKRVGRKGSWTKRVCPTKSASHGKDPFEPLRFEAPLAELKNRLAKGEPVFQDLIKGKMLNNTCLDLFHDFLRLLRLAPSGLGLISML